MLERVGPGQAAQGPRCRLPCCLPPPRPPHRPRAPGPQEPGRRQTSPASPGGRPAAVSGPLQASRGFVSETAINTFHRLPSKINFQNID